MLQTSLEEVSGQFGMRAGDLQKTACTDPESVARRTPSMGYQCRRYFIHLRAELTKALATRYRCLPLRASVS